MENLNGKIVNIEGKEYAVIDGMLKPITQVDLGADRGLFVNGGKFYHNDAVVGRLTTISDKQAEDENLPKGTATIVLSEEFLGDYDLELVQITNNNSKDYPDWANGDYIGTRKEWALVLKKVD